MLELSPTGILHLVADPETTAGQDGAIEALHNDDTGAEAGSHLHTPAVVDSGDILVSDTGKKRILRIHDGRSAVFLTDPYYVSVSLGHALLADRAGLLVRVHEERGHNLAVFGFPAG